MNDKSYVGLDLCFYCQEAKGVVLDRRLIASLPRSATYDHEPCRDCAEWMKQGIILISVSEKLTTDRNNPYRTGGWSVITEDSAKRLFTPESVLNSVLEKRVAFVSDDVWIKLGLPGVQHA